MTTPESLAAALTLAELGELKLWIERKLGALTPPSPPCTFQHRLLSEAYHLEELIAQGTYGYIWRARTVSQQQPSVTVALKQIKLKEHCEEQGFPIQALREIDALRTLRGHANIVHLYEVCLHPTSSSSSSFPYEVFLALEYFDTTVRQILEHSTITLLTFEQIRHIATQVLSALDFLHQHQYMHRDLKWENVLVDTAKGTGRVVLADFGMSRRAHAGRRYSNVVVTLHYRAPELLMLQDQYMGSAVDMWSMGCLLYELGGSSDRVVLFPGTCELEQLNLIWDTMGTPQYHHHHHAAGAVAEEEDWRRAWPEFAGMLSKLGLDLAEQNVRKLENNRGRLLPASTFALMERMLALDPAKRISAKDALASEWW